VGTRPVDAILKQLDSGPGSLLLCPAVGRFRRSLPLGAGVVPGLTIGTLTVLGQTHPVVAPADAHGSVAEIAVDDGVVPTEYGAELYRLGPRTERNEAAGNSRGGGNAACAAAQLAVRSPTEGMFYRRRDPQSPPYVELGDIVELGQALGLVEVMKSFNQVRYTGAGLPARAKIVAIPAADNSEITLGQILFVLEPA